jgi:septum formation topological specificity factor MinE
MADLPNEKSLSDVVEQLQELNEATEMAHESARYTQELRDYMRNEGHNLDASQLTAIEDLIAVLKEGRLDELEADKEELLRSRVEMRRDEERNDLLEGIAKYTNLSYEQLKLEFGDKGRFSIMGLLIKTALVGTLIGFFNGAFLEPFKFLGKGFAAIASRIGKVTGLDKFFKGIKVGVQAQLTKGIGAFTSLFATKGNKPPGFMSKSVTMMKNVFKDLFTILRVTVGNIVKVFSAFTGFMAGRFASLQSLTKVNFAPKIISKPFQAVGKAISAFTAPLNNFLSLFKTTTGPVVKELDKASKLATGLKGAKFGSAVFNFLAKGPKIIFDTLQKIGSAFRGLGKFLGRFFGVFNFIFGFFKGFKQYEDGSFLTKVFAGIMGGFKQMLLMGPVFLMDGVKWVLGKILGLFGFEKAAEFLSSFSFSKIVGDAFDFVTDSIIQFFARLKDSIADIGIGGLIKNSMLQLLKIYKKIVTFPLAVAAGGLGAIAAMLPGGRTPMEGFKAGFNKVFNAGDAKLENMKSKADGKDNKTGQHLIMKSTEGKELRDKIFADFARSVETSQNPPRPTISQQISQKGGDVVNMVTTATKESISSVGGIIANSYS